eukprot:824979_1
MTRNILFSFPDGDGIREGRVIYTAALRENDSLADGLSSLSMVQLNDLAFFHDGRAVDPFLSAHAQGIPDRSELLAVKHVESVPDQNDFSMGVDPVYVAYLEKKAVKTKAPGKKKAVATKAKAKVAKKKADGPTHPNIKKKAAAVKAIKDHHKSPKKNAKSANHPATPTQKKPVLTKASPAKSNTSDTESVKKSVSPKSVPTNAATPNKPVA